MDNAASNLSDFEMAEFETLHPATSSKPRLLIVEDDLPMRDLYFHLLNDDYELSFAEDGKTGLDYYRSINPELVILDIGLPDKSGFEVCQEMRAYADNASSCIMCVSGYDQDEDMLKAYKMGADDYTAKPFNPSVLVAKVKNLVQFQQQRSELLNACNTISFNTVAVFVTSYPIQIFLNVCLSLLRPWILVPGKMKLSWTDVQLFQDSILYKILSILGMAVAYS